MADKPQDRTVTVADVQKHGPFTIMATYNAQAAYLELYANDPGGGAGGDFLGTITTRPPRDNDLHAEDAKDHVATCLELLTLLDEVRIDPRPVAQMMGVGVHYFPRGGIDHIGGYHARSRDAYPNPAGWYYFQPEHSQWAGPFDTAEAAYDRKRSPEGAPALADILELAERDADARVIYELEGDTDLNEREDRAEAIAEGKRTGRSVVAHVQRTTSFLVYDHHNDPDALS